VSEGLSASRSALLGAAHISLSPLFGRFGSFDGLRRAGFAPEPDALALEVVDLPVVQEAIDEGCGQGRVVEDPPPFGQALVRGDDRGLFLLPGGDDLVEDRPEVRIRREVAELVELCGALHNSTSWATCPSRARRRASSSASWSAAMSAPASL
jgi:hypothetical protein